MRWRRKKKRPAETSKEEVAVATVPASTKVFGVPLDPDSSECPQIVSQCADHLKKNALETVGIFRIPGQVSEVQLLKSMYDEGKAVDLSECLDPNVVGGLLKLYLRELPAPLVPFNLYECVVDANDVEDTAHRESVLRETMELLPLGNHVVLSTVCELLFEISQHSAVNKMTVDNLAMVFGPNIIRSEVETAEKLFRDSSAVAGVMATLIGRSAAIFHTAAFLKSLDDYEGEIARVMEENKALRAELGQGSPDEPAAPVASAGPARRDSIATTMEKAASKKVYEDRVHTLRKTLKNLTVNLEAEAASMGPLSADEMPYKLSEGLESAIVRHVETGEPNYIEAGLNAATGEVEKKMAEMVDLAAFASMVPMDVCRYHVLKTAAVGTVLVVTVPTICKHLQRLNYVTMKDGISTLFSRLGLTFDKEIVLSDPFAVNDEGEYLHPELHPPPKVERAPFEKPAGPAKRGGRRLTGKDMRRPSRSSGKEGGGSAAPNSSELS